MAVFFTSDTHFQHKMVAGLRGNAHPEPHMATMAHDSKVINIWNDIVRPDDFVWHLGDVFLGDERGGLALVSQLNGHKHLITGNHDKVWPGHQDARKHQRAWLEVFESIQAYAKIKVTGLPNSVLMSHFPWLGDGEGAREMEERYSEFRLSRTNVDRWLIHGHTHSQQRLDGPRSVHIGWDAWHCPVSLTEVKELMGL